MAYQTNSTRNVGESGTAWPDVPTRCHKATASNRSEKALSRTGPVIDRVIAVGRSCRNTGPSNMEEYSRSQQSQLCLYPDPRAGTDRAAKGSRCAADLQLALEHKPGPVSHTPDKCPANR